MTVHNSTEHQEVNITRQKEPRIKARYLVFLIAFSGEILFFYHRMTISIGLVGMVNSSILTVESESSKACLNLIENVNGMNHTNEEVEKVNGEFQWSDKIQGYILGSGFFGYAISLPIAAKIAETCGGKKMLLYCSFLSSFFTFISPFAAYWSVYALISVQFLRGLSQGGFIPAPVMLIVNWLPKQERGLAYTFLMSGGPLGCMLGSYLSGILCESTFLGGWPSAFFTSGGVGFILCIIIFFCLYDNPSAHPHISPVELEYILKNQEIIFSEKRPKTPWTTLFKSIPIWALIFAFCGTGWANSHFYNANPIFLKTILHYSVEQDGLFTALPFLLQILTSYLSGVLSAVLIKKDYISVDKARKLMSFISTSGYSLCVLGIYFAGCDRFLAVFFSIGALAFIGFSYAGSFITSVDMSPNFAGSIDSITCCIGTIPTFIAPVIVGYLTNGSQTLEQWRNIFFISIAVVLSSGLVFGAFGSAKIQPWNDVSVEKSQEMREKGKE